MASSDLVHLLAGGAGGTAGAVITCPLEVVKTRLQSSVATFKPIYIKTQSVNYNTCLAGPARNIHFKSVHTEVCACHKTSSVTAERALHLAHQRSVGIYYCLRYIVENEGLRALFKGLGPNLIGVAPSRAIYFFCYANTKKYLNSVWYPDTPLVHIGAAVTAGVSSSTATNPIWLIKTRLQLDQKKNNSLTVRQCIRDVYTTSGFRGFYKGITASYVGVTETVIHFVIYEALKARFLERCDRQSDGDRNLSDFAGFMVAGAISKSTATCIAYPHEVVRTRLREEGAKYKSFLQTLILVAKEEGAHGLYRGLVTQLIRQIPNTAIMMSTYELVVYLHSVWRSNNG